MTTTKTKTQQDANEATIEAVASTSGLWAWFPIETAPTDGTWVLAVNAKTNRSRLHVVRYSERNGAKFPWVRGSAHMEFVAGLTHWMPLPEAPNANATGLAPAQKGNEMGGTMKDKNGTEIKAGDTLFNSHDRDQYHTVLQGNDGKLYLGDLDSPLERYAPQTWWEVVPKFVDN
jgi:hypothetical protein